VTCVAPASRTAWRFVVAASSRAEHLFRSQPGSAGDDSTRARLGDARLGACLGRDDIGAILLGMQADLALFTLDEPRFSGAHDPIAALVLCGAHRGDRVMVAGRWRVIDGAPKGVDHTALIAKHKAAARAFG
jgi:8-oxoguanine deaminase